jgi:ATP-dependent protease ClpP protease subunit
MQMSEIMDIENRTMNWNRSIIINSIIDDDLVKKLTPTILALRQKNNKPITVGIDSPGGSLASVDVILGLLKGPSQNGEKGKIITVVTNRAYSAAANLLAFGDYAIALPHSHVLYHDVRFGGIDDVTPEKARDAAKSLQEANDSFALKLANKIISRLLWVYVDSLTEFTDIQKKYNKIYDIFFKIVDKYVPKNEGFETFDLASFSTYLWVSLSSQNDVLIKDVMKRLEKWINLTSIAKEAPAYKCEESGNAGLLDGVKMLYTSYSDSNGNFELLESDLKLLICLIIAEISNEAQGKIIFTSILEKIVREYNILDSMNDSKHVEYAYNLLIRHRNIFVGGKVVENIENKSKDEKDEIYEIGAPYAKIIWHFCVLLCRALFEGEHILTPNDALLLGLVDEVSGGGKIKSLRDFFVEKKQRQRKI